jgi:hypothetical protein
MVKGEFIYEVFRVGQSMKIDGEWNKLQWEERKSVLIGNYMGSPPGFFPGAKAKMMYDRENLYLIFSVHDRYVRCLTGEINGPVWEDACVEFFFSPDTGFPGRYFNLEINCAGTPLMHYNRVPDRDIRALAVSDIKRIEIAHSLPGKIDPEITEPLTWTVEYRIPVEMLEKYSKITHPEPGVEWRANFYKIAENSSNPHYLTWSPVENDEPNFHLPQYFGLLKFT